MNYKAIGLAALSGAIGSAKTDLDAFRTWKSFSDVKAYSWSLALWRWFQGAFLGALAGAGLGGL